MRRNSNNANGTNGERPRRPFNRKPDANSDSSKKEFKPRNANSQNRKPRVATESKQVEK